MDNDNDLWYHTAMCLAMFLIGEDSTVSKVARAAKIFENASNHERCDGGWFQKGIWEAVQGFRLVSSLFERFTQRFEVAKLLHPADWINLERNGFIHDNQVLKIVPKLGSSVCMLDSAEISDLSSARILWRIALYGVEDWAQAIRGSIGGLPPMQGIRRRRYRSLFRRHDLSACTNSLFLSKAFYHILNIRVAKHIADSKLLRKRLY